MGEQEQEVRRKRLVALRAQGVDPFPARVPPRESIAQVRANYDGVDTEGLEEDVPVCAVGGRIRAKRSFGKLVFFQIEEQGISIQLSVRRGETPQATFEFINQCDVGDFIWAKGAVWRTKKGELTIGVQSVELLAKSLRPLPDKWHGLTDVEARFRQRHLDLLANERAREIAVLRSRVVSAVRRFLDVRDFLEVETPVLQPIYGGAAARPFLTYHHTFDQQLYLRISDELYLKRLIVGGLDRVYEIGHNFRNEGISRKHNPEFTMMECYEAYSDYLGMMDLTQSIVQEVAKSTLGTEQVNYQGGVVEFSGNWPRVSLTEAIRGATGIDILEADSMPTLHQALIDNGEPEVAATSWEKAVDEIFSRSVEPSLFQPTFVVDYPRALSPLAKGKAEDPRLAERFELFFAGFEIANAFSELNDPDDQRERFVLQQQAASAGDDEAHPMDEEYLATLEHGMPPTGGLGIGIDRLVMVLSDSSNLREVILFPHLRPESR